MKIVHIISSLEMGGAQAVLFDIARKLKKKGYDQTVLYLHDGPYRERFVIEQIPVIPIRGIVSPFDPIAWYRLITVLKQIQPDCIHTALWAANWLGRLAARFLGIRCVVSLHNNYDQNGIIRIMLDRLVSYKKTELVAVSQEVKQSFQQTYPAIAPVVIQNGIDVTALAKVQPVQRAALNLSDEHFVIGSVGRFHPIKRYPLLLESFKLLHDQCPETRLLMIGSGPEEQRLKLLAKQLGIAHLVCWVIGQPAHRYYPLFDCFVLTSQKEGISIALLEAMALKRCCVVTYHVAEHPVIANTQNGIVAVVKDATEFAPILRAIQRNSALREMIAKNAQQTIHEHFDANCMIAAYQKLFTGTVDTACHQ